MQPHLGRIALRSTNLRRILKSIRNCGALAIAVIAFNGCSLPGVITKTPAYVTYHDTYYGKSIRCVGQQLPQNKKFKYTGMVASFLDKTGKGSITTSKPITQGAADLAADSLAKFNFFKIKTAIPHNFRDNPQIFEFNKQGTDFFLHGSIVTLETTNDQKNASVSIDPVNIGHKKTLVTAVVHMSINSSIDSTVFINDTGDLASGNFRSQWNIIENDFGFFRIIGNTAINISGAVKVSQAADIAIHEAIEHGLVTLVGKMFDLPYKRCLPRRAGDFTNVNREYSRLLVRNGGPRKGPGAVRRRQPQSQPAVKTTKAAPLVYRAAPVESDHLTPLQ
jgi:hypothetical protein